MGRDYCREMTRDEAIAASRKAAMLRTARARQARDARILRVRLRWRLRQFGLPEEERRTMRRAATVHKVTGTLGDVAKIRRLHEELTVLDDEVAHHRREIKHITEARKEVDAELQRFIGGQPRQSLSRRYSPASEAARVGAGVPIDA